MEETGRRAAAAPPTDLLEVVGSYLNACRGVGTAPRVDELARWLGLSRNSLCALFVDSLGVRPSRLLKECQLAAALTLLDKTPIGIGRLGAEVGFGSSGSFIRAFRATIGVTPGAYRQQMQNVHIRPHLPGASVQLEEFPYEPPQARQKNMPSAVVQR